MRTITLQRALLGAIGIAILAGILPAGIALDRRLAAALESRARADLSLAPRILEDRAASTADAMMMHAKEFAGAAGLAQAVAERDSGAILRIIEQSRGSLGADIPVVVGPDRRIMVGPPPAPHIIEATRRGQMPVEMSMDGSTLRNIALAPLLVNGAWVGAAGVASPVSQATAEALAGLTRSGVTVIARGVDTVTATTLDSADAHAVLDAIDALPADGATHEVSLGGRRAFGIVSPLGTAGSVILTRFASDELAVLPALRRGATLSAAAALVVALVLGAVLARRVARPVQQLSSAAAALTAGTFDAPLPRSRIDEVARVAGTFDEMRNALAARLSELRSANAALLDRNTRLSALQADLMQRDRLAATGRLVAQLAHEIRNPVANLRNCLELIQRRVADDPEAREFVELAIDELLRMHELAEQMLDLNRPRDASAQRCNPTVVAREVATLATLGVSPHRLTVRVEGDERVEAAIAPDALKQVLINLVQNAREADAARKETVVEIRVERAERDTVIEVQDNGPGVPEDIRARLFDPFFTTKDAVHGVGLGLFVAEGLVRSAGGRIGLTHDGEGVRERGGATFRIELPAPAPPDEARTPARPGTAARA